MLELRRTSGRVRLRLRAIAMGNDLCVLLDGGDTPHIGAAALCGATFADVLPLPGHREAELAHELAQRLSAALDRTVAVICGIHLDDITREEIDLALRLAHELAEALPDAMNRPLADGGESPC